MIAAPVPLSLRLYFFDASLHGDTLQILQAEARRGWYLGESTPSFLKKIPELRKPTLTTEDHRQQIHALLPNYAALDEPVIDDEDEDEGPARSKPSCALAQLFPQGEISLHFAGPCVLLEINATRVESEADSERLCAELEQVLKALRANRDYVIVDSTLRAQRLTWAEVPKFYRAQRDHLTQSAAQRAHATRRSKLIFWSLNACFGLILVWLLIYGIQQLRTIQAIDLTEQLTFVVQKKYNAANRALFPEFRVDGVLRETSEPATLKLFRDEYATVQVGYELVALRSTDPAEPHVLAWYVEKHSPFAIGGFKINVELIVWAAFTLIWLALLRNYQKAPTEYQRESLRQSLVNLVAWITGACLVMMAIIWLRGLLG